MKKKEGKTAAHITKRESKEKKESRMTINQMRTIEQEITRVKKKKTREKKKKRRTRTAHQTKPLPNNKERKEPHTSMLIPTRNNANRTRHHLPFFTFPISIPFISLSTSTTITPHPPTNFPHPFPITAHRIPPSLIIIRMMPVSVSMMAGMMMMMIMHSASSTYFTHAEDVGCVCCCCCCCCGGCGGRRSRRCGCS